VDIFMNDNKVEDLTFETGTLEEALRCLQHEWCSPGHLVIGLKCDGLDIAHGEMAKALAKPVTEFKRLEVSTGRPGELVGEAMDQAMTALAETGRARTDVADLLTQGKTAEGIEALAESLSVWQQIHEAIAKSIRMLELEPDRVTIMGQPLEDAIGRPRDMLLQVKQALEAHDYVLLADVLQYEFDEVAELWKAVLAEIREYADHHDDVEDPT